MIAFSSLSSKFFFSAVLCTHDWSCRFVDRRITVCDQNQNILYIWSIAVNALNLCENLSKRQTLEKLLPSWCWSMHTFLKLIKISLII